MEDKLLITVAPSIPPYVAKSIPGLDLSPEGIADEVVRACSAGASIAHLHVWDETGQPTADLTSFHRTIELIRDRCDIIVEGSTGGAHDLTAQERSVSLAADIELASLNPGSVNYGDGVYINSPEDIDYWVSEMHRKQIKPDIAIFEPGMIANSMHYAEESMIQPPFLFTFVLGLQGAIPASPKNLFFLSESIPRGSFWCVCGQSGSDLRLSALAMNMGGNVRAGFEDNPYYRPGVLATSNAQLIERLERLAREVGKDVASPGEARQMLEIRKKT